MCCPCKTRQICMPRAQPFFHTTLKTCRLKWKGRFATVDVLILNGDEGISAWASHQGRLVPIPESWCHLHQQNAIDHVGAIVECCISDDCCINILFRRSDKTLPNDLTIIKYTLQSIRDYRQIEDIFSAYEDYIRELDARQLLSMITPKTESLQMPLAWSSAITCKQISRRLH